MTGAEDQLETTYRKDLTISIKPLDSLVFADQAEEFLAHYLQARSSFKRTEPVLAFVDKENYKSLNAPNILKVEEEDLTNIKIIEPVGFQVLEELLFEEPLDTASLKETARVTGTG